MDVELKVVAHSICLIEGGDEGLGGVVRANAREYRDELLACEGEGCGAESRGRMRVR